MNSRLLYIASLVMVFSATSALAQESELEHETGFMMMNRNICPGAGEQMVDMSEKIAPILNDMEAEGEIRDWGVLTHAWGDEYNFSWYMITDSHEQWRTAWNALMKRVQEQHPKFMEKTQELCVRHKDNLFTLHKWE